MLVSSAKSLNNNLSEQFGRSFIYNRTYSTQVWVGGCRPDLETLTLFMIKKKFVKILEIDTLFMIFRSNSTHFFVKMRDF